MGDRCGNRGSTPPTTGSWPTPKTSTSSTASSRTTDGIADDRLTRNVAATAKVPVGDIVREGQILTEDEVHALADACRGRYGELVVVLAYEGFRWGELAGLQVGDLIDVPGRGVRIQRTVLAALGAGELFIDTAKNHKARTVPLTANVAEIVDRWSAGKRPHDWLFGTATGTALNEGNWKRQIGWRAAKEKIGRPSLRVHDLRHTAASIWLGKGADPKVVQRVLGHASATMTMDLYGHLIDTNLWAAAERIDVARGHHGGTEAERRIGRMDV